MIFKTHILSSRNPLMKDHRTSAAFALLQGLKDPNCNLKTISLSSCKLSSAFPENLSPKMLFTNESLEKLDLSANTLGDSGLKHLCEGLKHPHCNLQTLLLWQCHLTAACCGDLSAALSTNQSLTELELSGNELGDSGIKLLCDGLKHPSCKLQKLVLCENHIDERTTKELDVLQKIKPGLSIVHYAALSPESPGAKRSWMSLLLSQRYTYICRALSWIAEFLWYISVMHWEVGLVLLLSMATYWLL
ncbi:hypothetical protein KIL84_007778 [Mauremys mutica]|uniref:Uncharacterized protein n=1 Tax=Mauremys mutica TaxID=74926 RepID=A0A9D3X415_9SAUR|nr:hypothetical protein KIL84_007778 [Mauremys mutica]